MVFSSIPVYLDPPNWTQQQAEPPGVVLGNGAHHDDQGINPQLLPSVSAGGGPGGNSNIRLGSMTDRARLAKIPQPEAALKCPRCESTNTKFCYFNNYSLTQPRHFCKTCRRYWTRGGALRNVPVGGGCRRNKRSSKSRSSRSKSPAIDHHVLPQAAHHGGSTSTNTDSSNGCAADPHVIGYFDPTASPQLPFLPSLHHLSSSDYGFNFAGLSSNQPQVLATIAQGTGPGNIPEQWRLNQVQQFSFLTNLEPPCVSGLCTFDQGVNRVCNMSKPFDNSDAIVKMEENRRHHDLSRKFMGGQGNGTHDDDHQFNWSEGNHAWNDLSGFNSSSSSHLL